MIDIFNIQENKVTEDLLAYPQIIMSKTTGQGKTWSMNEFLRSISPEGKKPLFLILS